MAGPTVAVAITKRTLWHGQQESFDNVYYFDGPAFQAGDENYKRLVDAIVAAEKPVHGTSVEFMTARVWSAGGTIIQNITLGLYDLDGFGTAAGSTLFGEAAALIEWQCERPNVLGRKVYLRKYIRSQQSPGALTTDQATGKAALPAATVALYKSYADAVDIIPTVGGVIFYLVSPTGRSIRAADNGVVNTYYISREFRRN